MNEVMTLFQGEKYQDFLRSVKGIDKCKDVLEQTFQ